MSSSSSARDGGRGGLSRRRFLGGFGAGAVSTLTLGPSAAAAAELAQPAAAAQSPDRFGRLFPTLEPFAQPTPAVQAALTELGRLGGIMDAKDALDRGPVALITDPTLGANNRDNPNQTAGVTFMGQFFDHDMTFDTTSRLGVATDPQASPNARTPSFDLDSVYGRGPVADPVFYNTADRAKLAIESGGQFEDLPRTADNHAIIPDPRNDENLMVAGLHLAFIKFHNRAVDEVRRQSPGVDVTTAFNRARQLTTWHYQWLIVHEFLPHFVGDGLVSRMLSQGRRFYRPATGQAFMPVEFQGAVYRFGHSMVRPSYRANLKGDNGNPFFGMVFDPAGEGQADPVDLRGRARAPRRFIGWQTFFNFGDGAFRSNKRIDTRISTPLFRLPLAAIASGDPPIALPQRNLLRHLTWSLPSGQRCGEIMGLAPILRAGDLPELRALGVGFENSTPLWYYILKEAEVITEGHRLGPVGSEIVGEVFLGLLQADPASYLSVQPTWRPTLPSQTPGDFRMTDFLRFAQVDPASRGQ